MIRLSATLRLAVLLIGTPLAPSWAQTNGSSFSAAESTPLQPAGTPAVPQQSCADLAGQRTTAYEILDARPDPAFSPGSCTVIGRTSPTVEFVVNLPASWNRRLYVHGNGGYGGESVRGPFGEAVRKRAVSLGLVAAFTNLGHDAAASPGASWAYDNPEAEIDYSFRALHQTTVAAKALIAAYFGRPVSYAYFEGCSTGGGQGLKAAQRYPDDYDGIAIGAPVFDFVGLQLYGWNNQMAIRNVPLDAETVARLGEYVLDRYDAVDGLRDGVIGDPRDLDFQPARELSATGPGRRGFTEQQVATFERIYTGPTLNGKRLYPGIPVGAEPAGQKYRGGSFEPAAPASGWATRLYPDATGYSQQLGNVETWLKYLAFEEDDPDYDWQSLDLTRELPRMRFMSAIMDATDIDLSDFQRRGGKLLIYHGWADTGVNPWMTVDYYDRVRAEMGRNVERFFRLFMVPGMFHCRGGLNVDRFDVISPVIAWVEQGIPPEELLAARMEDGRITRTRPICSYPHTARYQGSGSADAAGSFRCEPAAKGSTEERLSGSRE